MALTPRVSRHSMFLVHRDEERPPRSLCPQRPNVLDTPWSRSMMETHPSEEDVSAVEERSLSGRRYLYVKPSNGENHRRRKHVNQQRPCPVSSEQPNRPPA